MFDMGFTELMLIGIVALIVIGPERLPGVARTAGKYFSKLRNFMTSVRTEVESELKADELRQIFEKQEQELNSLKEAVSDAGKDIGLSEITESLGDVDSEIRDLSTSPPVPTPQVKTKSEVKAKRSPKKPVKSVVKKESSTKVAPTRASKLKSKLKPRSTTKPKAKPKTRPASKTKAKAKAKAKGV